MAFMRYYTGGPYNWNATGWPWKAPIGPMIGGKDRTRPWNHASDRQVAFFELHNVTQGFYVCANHGNCTAPAFRSSQNLSLAPKKRQNYRISTGLSTRTCR